MAYTLDFGLALGGSKTGLTMAAQLVDTTGTNTGSELTTGFAEIGQGYYQWHYTAFADGFRGGVKFYEDGITGTILAFAAINPEEGEYVDQQLTTLLTTAMTESYASDGSAPTLAQAQFATQQFLQERSISNLTLTVKKLDGTTTAQTFTLNDAATPSSITRAS